MNCPNCGAPLNPGAQHCGSCGSPITHYTPVSYAPPSYQAPNVNNYYVNSDNLPPQYRPLGAWAYFGYMLLFSIPIIGFILLIVFSFSEDNINRRNFARSYWCALILVVIVVAILFAVGVLGAHASYRYYYY